MCYARCGHVGFPSLTRLNRLGSPLDKTPWPVIQDGFGNFSLLHSYLGITACSFAQHRSFQAADVYYHVVSCTFHFPSGILFTFRSCYYCAIGLGMYLGLGVGITHIGTAKPSRLTLGHPTASTLSLTGLSPSLVEHSRTFSWGGLA